MIQFLSNAFNDPSDPLYYVIGVIFLLLIFGALALYIYLTGKKNKQNAQSDNQNEPTDADKTEAPTAEEQAVESTDTVAEPPEQDKE